MITRPRPGFAHKWVRTGRFSLLLTAAVALAACGRGEASWPGAPTSPAPAASAALASPAPTALPTLPPPPAPDLNIALENHLDAYWRRADVTWSPDSRYLAATYWAGWRAQTFLIDGRTGEATDLTTDDGLNVGLTAWSPDGKKLAAIAGEDMDVERSGVWLFAGGRKIRLLDGACEELSWSPDSVVLLATCELYYWQGAPPPLDQASSITETAQQGGVWGGGQLWRMDTRANTLPERLLDLVQSPLVAFGAGTRFDTARRAAWSPSGDRVAFEVRSEDKAIALKMGVAVADARGGSPRLVTTKPVWLVGWLPDGKLLVRSNVFAGQIAQYTDDLYALDLGAGQAQNLTRVDPRCDALQNPRCQGARRQILTTPDYAALSPTGRRFYYRASGRSDVIGSRGGVDWLVVSAYPPSDLALEYSAAHEEPSGARLLYPAWLADGRLAHVHTVGYDPQARTAPGGSVNVQFVVDGQAVRTEDIGTWDVFAVGFSPDGRRAAVATDFGLLVYGLPPAP